MRFSVKKKFIFIIIAFSSLLLGCKKTIYGFSSPNYEYKNETLRISCDKNEMIFPNVKSYNLSSSGNINDYYIAKGNSRCVILQTIGEKKINNKVNTFNRVLYYYNFLDGIKCRVSKNVFQASVSDDMKKIMYIKNYDYTSVNKVKLFLFDTKSYRVKSKIIRFADYPGIEDFPLVKLQYENDNFYLNLWSDGVMYGKLKIDVDNDTSEYFTN